MGWFSDGLFGETTKHAPAKARNPRPKGAQKGTVYRNTDRWVGDPGIKARTPWLPKDKRDARHARKSGWW